MAHDSRYRRDLAAMIEDQGLKVVATRETGKHRVMKLENEHGEVSALTVAKSPSDRRTHLNVRADLRRIAQKGAFPETEQPMEAPPMAAQAAATEKNGPWQPVPKKEKDLEAIADKTHLAQPAPPREQTSNARSEAAKAQRAARQTEPDSLRELVKLLGNNDTADAVGISPSGVSQALRANSTSKSVEFAAQYLLADLKREPSKPAAEPEPPKREHRLLVLRLSEGDHELIKPLLDRLGIEPIFQEDV